MLTEAEIRTALTTVIESCVGNLLSTVKTKTSTRPAIIKFQQKGPRPDFPYISLDNIDVESQGRTYDISVVSDDTGTTTGVAYSYLDRTVYNIRCCGNQASDIAKELKKKLETPTPRRQFKTLLPCANILQIGRLVNVPTLLATEYSYDYILAVTINYIDSIEDTTETSIDTISIPPSNGTLVP